MGEVSRTTTQGITRRPQRRGLTDELSGQMGRRKSTQLIHLSTGAARMSSKSDSSTFPCERRPSELFSLSLPGSSTTTAAGRDSFSTGTAGGRPDGSLLPPPLVGITWTTFGLVETHADATACDLVPFRSDISLPPTRLRRCEDFGHSVRIRVTDRWVDALSANFGHTRAYKRE